MNQNFTQPTTFLNLGIAPSLLTRLDKLNFKQPTPIQNQTIPSAISGQDIVGIAQTGTGKTLAFSLPMIQRISMTKKTGLIILPTRELALQVDEALRQLCHGLNLRTAVIIGGAPMNKQIRAIRSNPQVIIATPGRLNDHLKHRAISLSKIGILILDEADRMLDMGFEPQIKQILKSIPRDRQTMLFSATMPVKIANIARTYMRQPRRIEVNPAGTTVRNIKQEVFFVKKNQKFSLLQKLLAKYNGQVLVFSRTKYGAKKIARSICQKNYPAAEIHSNRSLAQRKKALLGFKAGTYRVLVATDIAARGIDVQNIELVINFDLPDNPEDYVHRVGRTARAGKSGVAVSFALPEQKRDIYQIERLIRTRLNISPLPTDLPLAVETPRSFSRPPKKGGKFSNNRFSRKKNFHSRKRHFQEHF